MVWLEQLLLNSFHIFHQDHFYPSLKTWWRDVAETHLALSLLCSEGKLSITEDPNSLLQPHKRGSIQPGLTQMPFSTLWPQQPCCSNTPLCWFFTLLALRFPWISRGWLLIRCQSHPVLNITSLESSLITQPRVATQSLFPITPF